MHVTLQLIKRTRGMSGNQRIGSKFKLIYRRSLYEDGTINSKASRQTEITMR